MKMLELNDNPQLWMKKAKGFKLALELCLNHWTKIYKQGLINAENLLILEPMKHLTFTSIELYLRSYLLTHEVTWTQCIEIMKRGKHDLSLLLDECRKYDQVFSEDTFSYIPLSAGSTKNYKGSRYPESGASASMHDLMLLNRLDEIVSARLNQYSDKK